MQCVHIPPEEKKRSRGEWEGTSRGKMGGNIRRRKYQKLTMKNLIREITLKQDETKAARDSRKS